VRVMTRGGVRRKGRGRRVMRRGRRGGFESMAEQVGVGVGGVGDMLIMIL
jgi:hypothetical protein